MKQLKDLKEEIMNKQFQSRYIFYGEDYGLRHLYIHEIAKSIGKITLVDSYEALVSSNQSSGLFQTKNVYILHNDFELAKLSSEKLKVFFDRMKKSDCLIMVYEEGLLNSTLFKEYDDIVTHFPTVSDNIAKEFVDSEIKLSLANKEDLAMNCSNNYNNILLETDKIKMYAQGKNISPELAYEELKNQGQLVYKPDPYSYASFMNDVLKGNFNNLGYWTILINTYYQEAFWKSIPYIFNDYLIAYLIKQYGTYEGSNRAYDYKLPWGRTKEIRQFIMPYDADYLLETAYEVSKLDLNIKRGLVSQNNLFDHFMCTIM